MQLNDWQKAVARIYGGGDYAYFATRYEIDDDELDSCGDTLFEFLMIELSDTEDCDSPEEAVRRVRSARDQLDEALTALEAAFEVEVHADEHSSSAGEVPLLPVLPQSEETLLRKAEHFETLLGILKILAKPPADPSFDLDFWRARANAAITKAEAILAGVPDPG